MKHFAAWLQEAHDNLSDLLNEPREDWDSLFNTVTDETLEEMGHEFALTHNAPNTTPLYVS